MISDMFRALEIAEEIVQQYGDLDIFKRSYVINRENNGILESIKLSLVQQDLWKVFVSRI